MFLMIVHLIEKRNPPLMKVHLRKMHLIEFKICVIAGNGSRVVFTHQIFRIVIHICVESFSCNEKYLLEVVFFLFVSLLNFSFQTIFHFFFLTERGKARILIKLGWVVRISPIDYTRFLGIWKECSPKACLSKGSYSVFQHVSEEILENSKRLGWKKRASELNTAPSVDQFIEQNRSDIGGA